jgi:hypothetical protein
MKLFTFLLKVGTSLVMYLLDPEEFWGEEAVRLLPSIVARSMPVRVSERSVMFGQFLILSSTSCLLNSFRVEVTRCESCELEGLEGLRVLNSRGVGEVFSSFAVIREIVDLADDLIRSISWGDRSFEAIEERRLSSEELSDSTRGFEKSRRFLSSLISSLIKSSITENE